MSSRRSSSPARRSSSPTRRTSSPIRSRSRSRSPNRKVGAIITVENSNVVTSALADRVIFDFKQQVPGDKMMVSLAERSNLGASFAALISNDVTETKKKVKENYAHLGIETFSPASVPTQANAEVLIIETRTQRDDMPSVGLTHFLKNNGVRVIQTKGPEAKYQLHQNLSERGLHSIVISLNETLSLERVREIADLVVRWALSPRGKGKVASGLGRGLLLGTGLGLLGGLAIGSAAASSHYRRYPSSPR